MSVSRLTPRELEVARAIAAGKRTAAIAFELGASPRTIETHRRAIIARTGARTIVQAIVELQSRGEL